MYCGDGIRVGSEDCDDGNTIPGDGCSESCEVEHGWICRGRARDKWDYCTRLGISDVAITCTGPGCNRLAMNDSLRDTSTLSGALIILTKRVVEHQDVDLNGMVVVRARPDGEVWIEPGSKLLRADDKVRLDLADITSLEIFSATQSCRCPGIGRGVPVGEACLYPPCLDEQFSRGMLICNQGARLVGVMPGCVRRADLSFAKSVGAALLTVEWIVASDAVLSLLDDALDTGRLQELLRASLVREKRIQPSSVEVIYTGTFKSPRRALIFSVALIDVLTTSIEAENVTFLTDDLIRGFGIEADQLTESMVVVKEETLWWSMPAADNRKGTSLHGGGDDDGV